jgi:hypothetical protein
MRAGSRRQNEVVVPNTNVQLAVIAAARPAVDRRSGLGSVGFYHKIRYRDTPAKQ